MGFIWGEEQQSCEIQVRSRMEIRERGKGGVWECLGKAAILNTTLGWSCSSFERDCK
jgi:hypothetical protein